MARKQSKGEVLFLHWWKLLSGLPPPPEPELLFAKSIGRNWRFDFAWPAQMIAVEIDGGAWLSKHGKKGRHTTGQGFEDDCEKLNAAAILGWRVLRYTIQMVERDPSGCINEIKQALR